MNTFPGSKWWKVDFHAHTPASVCYGKNHPDEKALKKYPLKEWLLDYMKAGIDCVAVTDHNTGAAIDDIKAAYEDLTERKPAGFRKLTILPGVEITALGNVHILGIFPETTELKDINTVVDNCEYDGEKGASNDCTKQSPADVIDKITKKGGLAIPAHAGEKTGIFGALQGPTLKKILENDNIIAMECAIGWEPPQSYKENKLNWARVTGSDQHHPTGEPGQKFPGSHFTWVKMETPCWEELRQALLAHEVCVLDQTEEDPNKTPDIFLRSLTIKEMSHCGAKPGGKPLTFEFNPFFNAFIGGRGTGKSTALESIRIAARRKDQLHNDGMDKLAQDLDEFTRLSKQNGVMKTDTELVLTVARRGIDYRLTWRQNGSHSLEQFDAGEWIPSQNEGDLLDRFPMDIFSQKQIYTLASAPQGLLAIIDRSPQVNKQDWHSRWAAKVSEYRELRERRRRLLAQTVDEKTLNARLTDLKNDMKTYEDSGHGETLTEYQYRKRQKQALPLTDDFDGLADKVKSLAEDIQVTAIPSDLFKDGDPHEAEIREIHSTMLGELNTIGVELQGIAKKIETVTKTRKESLEASKWYAAVQEAESAYQEIQTLYEGKDNKLEDYDEWVKQRGKCEKKLAQIEEHRNNAKRLEMEITTCQQELVELREELYNARKTFIEKTLKDNQYVQMELVPYGDTSQVEAKYRELFDIRVGYDGSLLDQEKQCGLLWELTNWVAEDAAGKNIPAKLKELREATDYMLRTKEKAPGHDIVDGRLPVKLAATHEANPSCMDNLLTWWPEDLLRVRHGDPKRKDDFKELEKGSAGQKAAAMLAFLLSHGTTPLIIDQPEDDLDSELIYSLIVQHIVDKKRQRQLILVTHNANIVVNGDAELVHALGFGGDQIRLQASGGLGQKAIRNKICSIMEGGKIAFKKRYNRIVHDK
ncbi:TrlF family AAA-like ATPase [Desulfovibrio oxyclinae]|uniref:TrlF family AAA-like ATPase n=1 Tax=Desulfovibrio oxyclinae TaxID=63560 RepID=UPI00036B5380|nr:AAA family ATPase [Desulfovibrio oxyclinae]